MMKILVISAISVVMGYSAVNATNTSGVNPDENVDAVRIPKKTPIFMRTPQRECLIDPVAIKDSTLKCINQRKKWLYL